MSIFKSKIRSLTIHTLLLIFECTSKHDLMTAVLTIDKSIQCQLTIKTTSNYEREFNFSLKSSV